MSGDHNMNQTSPGWRKRQIALDKMAENARELGLDYEPSIIERARRAGAVFPADGSYHKFERHEDLETFAKLVREDEREKYKWDIHSCGPTCTKVGCVAVREAVQDEREACARVCEQHGYDYYCGNVTDKIAETIRARGQA